MVGLKQASVHKTMHCRVQRALVDNEIVLVEAMANLDQLRSKDVFLICLPLPHVGLDRAEVRTVAWDPVMPHFAMSLLPAPKSAASLQIELRRRRRLPEL